MLNHITYDSFGQITSETDPAFDFRFGYTGRERDEESDLMYYRARYFDPATGTFVGEDPLGFAAGDANLYRYVFNSPTNFTDPSGEIAGGMEGGGVRIPWRAIGDAIVVRTGAAGDYIRDQADNISDAFRNRQTPSSVAPISSNATNLPGADAFPTTVATPDAFDPNDAQRQPQARPQIDSLTPPTPRPTPGASEDFDPNRINDKNHSHPNSRDSEWCRKLLGVS